MFNSPRLRLFPVIGVAAGDRYDEAEDNCCTHPAPTRRRPRPSRLARGLTRSLRSNHTSDSDNLHFNAESRFFCPLLNDNERAIWRAEDLT